MPKHELANLLGQMTTLVSHVDCLQENIGDLQSSWKNKQPEIQHSLLTTQVKINELKEITSYDKSHSSLMQQLKKQLADIDKDLKSSVESKLLKQDKELSSLEKQYQKYIDKHQSLPKTSEHSDWESQFQALGKDCSQKIEDCHSMIATCYDSIHDFHSTMSQQTAELGKFHIPKSITAATQDITKAAKSVSSLNQKLMEDPDYIRTHQTMLVSFKSALRELEETAVDLKGPPPTAKASLSPR